jgi:uncharacterized membrane protein
MKLGKKWLVIAAVALSVILAGTIGGAVLAADNDATPTTTDTTAVTTTTSSDALLDQIIAIYREKTGTTLDKAALQASIQEARQQLRLAELQTRLQAMVDAGTITQDQADQILAWYQDMPDVLIGGGLGLGGHGRARGGPGGGMCW